MTEVKDEVAFTRAVLDEPDDDVVRLVYADWLDEHGCPGRAEFIRLQVELASKGYLGPLTVGAALGVVGARLTAWLGEAHRCCALLAGHAEEWLAPWRDQPGVFEKHTRTWGWSRGFVTKISLPCSVLLGGTCPVCDGRPTQVRFKGPGATNPYYWDCPDCNGIGRFDGLIASLFRHHPVREVELSDKAPTGPGSGSPGGTQLVCWQRLSRASEVQYASHSLAYVIPDELFELLPGEERLGTRAKYYETREEAASALSKACVTLGKLKAAYEETQQDEKE